MGCQRGNTNPKKLDKGSELKELSDITFEQYCKSLDQITLPLYHNPERELPNISKNYDRKGFKKYSHKWTVQPLGILYKSKESIGIIDCSIGDWGFAPFLITYDLKGSRVDSISIYNKSGRDIGYEAIEYAVFNKNLSISVMDTVKQWEIKEDHSDIIEGSMKMTTATTKYQILKDGRIMKN